MPSPKEIQQRLIQEQYQKVIVYDLGTFPWCVAKTKTGEESRATYDKWKSGEIGAKFNPLLGANQASNFTNAVKQINAQPNRISECSNFAYHAAGVLLDDPKIRAEYDVAIVGCMGQNADPEKGKKAQVGKHNIAVLVPKGQIIPEGGPLPKGSLIVDPWAVAMGHDPSRALACKPEEFAYSKSLYQGFKPHYQSAKDPTLADLPSGTLKPYTDSSSKQAQMQPSLSLTSPRSSLSTSAPASSAPTSSQPASSANSSNSSYDELWRNSLSQIQREPNFTAIRGNTDQANMQAIKTVLNDYTKGGDNWWSGFKRAISGHWNRHHVSEVDKVVKQIDNKEFASTKDLVTALEKVSGNNKANPTGSFAARLNFIKSQAKEAEPEPVRNERGPGIQMR